MNQKGEPTTLAERIEIGERSGGGETDRQIAQALGRPLATVRKWRRRYEREGRAGLTSRMGRPASGILGQFAEEVKNAILEMRRTNPGWGAQTIRLELAKETRFSKQRLPSRARIAAYLKEQDLVGGHERQEQLPQPKPQAVKRAHQEWEVDAQGKRQVAGIGEVSLITMMDVYSHLSVEAHACPHTSHPNTQDYQLVLRRAFLRHGLPEQISFDHDSVFYDNHAASPFPTRLHLWLIALGVQVRFIHKPPPLEHARIERHHQTLTHQAMTGKVFDSLSQLQRNLHSRMLFLNREYPSRALGGQAPLQADPQAAHSRRSYRPEWEAEMLDLQRVYDYLAQGRWFRRVSTVGTFSLGDQRYSVSTHLAKQTLEITFDAQTQTFVCLPEKSSDPLHVSPKALTREALMGEIVPLVTFSNYQLALPFSPAEQRMFLLLGAAS